MKIIVNKHDIEIIKDELINEKEVNVSEIEYEFSEEYNVDGLDKKAIFTNETTGKSVEVAIIDNKSIIPIEAVEENGSCLIGVYAYKISEENIITYRLNPSPKFVKIENGSMKMADNTTPPTPSRYEQYVEALNQKLEQLEKDIEDFREVSANVEKQGQYAEEQGDKAKELIDNFSGTIEEIRASVPKKISDLPNDSGFVTNAVNDLLNYYLKSESYTKEEVNNLISAIPKFSIDVVETLPTENISESTIYLVPNQKESDDMYQEWIYVKGKWEKLGTQKLDLSDYYTKSEVDNAVNQKVDKSALNGYYTSTRVDELLNGKVSKSTYENKVQEIETSLGNKLEESDLNDYVKNTDYATSDKGGVVKTSDNYKTKMYQGRIYADVMTYSEYTSTQGVNQFISRGTLENVITGKDLANKNDIKEYVDSLNANEVVY